MLSPETSANRSLCRLCVLACVLTCGYFAPAQNVRALVDPKELTRKTGPIAGQDVHVSLEVKYADNKIYNPATLNADAVKLRSYNGALVGPTIRVHPGDTLYVTLTNNLPKDDPSCPADIQDHDLPNCFNSTNLHTHGLHVSPAGNSDNVLLSIPPGTVFE